MGHGRIRRTGNLWAVLLLLCAGIPALSAPFGPPRALAPEGRFYSGLALAVDSASNAYVAFSGTGEGADVGVYVVRVVADSQQAERVALPGCRCVDPALAVGQLGVVHAVFAGQCAGGGELYWTDNRGGPLQSPRQVTHTDMAQERLPFLRIDTAGRLEALWQELSENGTQLMRALQWGAPEVVAEDVTQPVAFPGGDAVQVLYRQGDTLLLQAVGGPPEVVSEGLLGEDQYAGAVAEATETTHVVFGSARGLFHTYRSGLSLFSTPQEIPSASGTGIRVVAMRGGGTVVGYLFEHAVYLCEFDGSSWGTPYRVTEPELSVTSFTLAGDRDGFLHLVTVVGARVYYQNTVPPPAPAFSATPVRGEAPLVVQFRDESSGGPIKRRLWDFGDGTQSSDRDPLHTYQNPGTYGVSLTLAGPGGTDTAVKEDFIVVEEPQNFLRVPTVAVWPGQGRVLHPVYAIHPQPLQGFQLAFAYDPSYLRNVHVELEGSATSLLEPELTAVAVTDGPGGEKHLVYGLVIDAEPPFDGRTLLPSESGQLIALLSYDVALEAPMGEVIPIELRNGVGLPPIDNVFTVLGARSVLPQLSGGGAVVVRRPDCPFLRGDANFDSEVNLADAVYCLNYLFAGRPQDLACADAADANDHAGVDIADAVYVLNYLFGGGSTPPYPFPQVGADPTADALPACRCP